MLVSRTHSSPSRDANDVPKLTIHRIEIHQEEKENEVFRTLEHCLTHAISCPKIGHLSIEMI